MGRVLSQGSDAGDRGELGVIGPYQVEAVTSYPGDKGAQELMVFDLYLFAAAFLQVLVDLHEGGEPEAGLDYPGTEGTGLGQGFVVGEGDEPLETKFFDQPSKPDDGQFQGPFSFVGARMRDLISPILNIHLAAFT